MFHVLCRTGEQDYLGWEEKKTERHSRLEIISLKLLIRTVSPGLTQNRFVVEQWVCKMEIAVLFLVVKLHCYSVMRFLIHRPYESNQTQE